MINIYTNKEHTQKKEFTAIRIKQGEKNGNPYTIISISDSHKDGDNYIVDAYYSIFVNKCLNIEEKDKFTIDNIYSIDLGKENEVNGKKYKNNTIFADVTVVGKNQPTIAPVISDEELPF